MYVGIRLSCRKSAKGLVSFRSGPCDGESCDPQAITESESWSEGVHLEAAGTCQPQPGLRVAIGSQSRVLMEQRWGPCERNKELRAPCHSQVGAVEPVDT